MYISNGFFTIENKTQFKKKTKFFLKIEPLLKNLKIFLCKRHFMTFKLALKSLYKFSSTRKYRIVTKHTKYEFSSCEDIKKKS